MDTSYEIYYSPRTVAWRLNVGIETVWRWIRQGRLRAVRLNRRYYRIRQTDLVAFMSEEVVPERE